jgi:nucleoside-diphosphate-sugar epimerase
MALWLLMATCPDIDLPHIHIGSQRPISIKDLALTVQSRMEILANKRVPVRVENLKSAYDGSSRYVPSTELTRKNLNVEEWTNLELSIDQMLRAVLPTV